MHVKYEKICVGKHFINGFEFVNYVYILDPEKKFTTIFHLLNNGDLM
jgi:hypothetical protein